MSRSPLLRASIKDGPALKMRVVSVDGASAVSNSFEETPRTACAWVRFAKYPSRTSRGGAAGFEESDVESDEPQPRTVASSAERMTRRSFINDESKQDVAKCQYFLSD